MRADGAHEQAGRHAAAVAPGGALAQAHLLDLERGANCPAAEETRQTAFIFWGSGRRNVAVVSMGD